MFRIKYLDNSGRIREYEVKAAIWAEAVSDLEANANEIGHGIQAIFWAVREG